MVVAALYVQRNGCYYGLSDVDPWDIERDARKYAGPHPVVAHPPCERWHKLSAVNHKRWGYRINEDGGCFLAALSAVRSFGGVLEHPAQSRAFEFYGLPTPRPRSWQRTIDGDWVTEVCQSTYGHRAMKETWLVYHGNALPPRLDWRRVRGTHQIGLFDATLPQLPKAERAATPPAFRDLLLSIARSAQQRQAA
jgi:hypothetical protein